MISKNPLFPEDGEEPDDNQASNKPGYLLPSSRNKIAPLTNPDEPAKQNVEGANPAASLIREKLALLYEQEPGAKEEEQEAETAPIRSQHQQFMYTLSTSGKSLAEIQTDWHNYYVSLPEDQKHQVWQEFYDANNVAERYQRPKIVVTESAPPQKRQIIATKTGRQGIIVDGSAAKAEPKPSDKRSGTEIKQAIRNQVKKRTSKLSTRHKQNLHSLIFGLSMGFVVLLILMFGFFNEVIIAPFIQPGRATATPIIIDSDSVAASGVPKVIIPKINAELPVVYNVPSNDEAVIENNLENGVVHYPTTVLPGQTGNSAFFGHSSNNIFNKGKYKFAFVLLHELQKGDTFYLIYNGTVYAYKVISRTIVDPSDVGVLGNVPGQKSTATLITCDPPGTSLHRLVVVGQQISPDPSGNTTGNNTSTGDSSNGTTQLAGNGPSLWSRFWGWVF